MPYKDANQLRRDFLKFFEDKGCKPLPSSSLVPPDDSTLFTSAGMHQFKPDFMGDLQHKWPDGKPVTRAATVQKCMRTPDLENVGRTARHHTFFEMLGFFSFGDFFKREAIGWIWEFYTSKDWCGLDVSKLYVSVYGETPDAPDRDQEAYDIWLEVLSRKENFGDKKAAKARIYWLGEHDNFWPAGAPSQGPNGVCGPCSEIFYDLGDKYGQGDVASNGDRFMEIGNIVFTQFERSGPVPGKGVLTPLPAKNIDFGGGFERLVMVLEDAKTTLDTSLFHAARDKVKHYANLRFPGQGEDPESEVRIKRICDHIRAVTFAMSDGILPSNEGAGYVIRRIIRRAYRDGIALGISGPFLFKTAPAIIGAYKEAYPELTHKVEAVSNIIQQEEQQFSTTLERGLQQLAGLIRSLKDSGEKTLAGKPAFDLYQSQGLPREVVQDELAAEGLHLDQVGYDEAEQKHREASRGGKQAAVFEKGWFQEVKARAGRTQFLGYETCEADAKVVAIIRGDQAFDIIEKGDSATVVLDRTPFYGESGGQVGDRGSLHVHDAPHTRGVEQGLFEVADTQKRDDIHLHEGKLVHGKLRVGDTVTARVDQARRDKIRANHSATHLLHAALRQVLGDHVVQRGSEVGPDRLRFDFSHPKALTFEERQEIERLVNEQIQANTDVEIAEMPPDEAQKDGAVALFGEKYGDKVRVLTMGREGYSKELCGGTHVARTGDIGYFRVVSEGSSAAGIRRIEAVTGQVAYGQAAEDARLLAELHALTKAQPGKVLEKVSGLLKEVKDLKGKAKKGGAASGALDAVRKSAQSVDGVTIYAAEVPDAETDALLTISDALRQDGASSAVLLGSRGEGRALLLLSFTKDLTGRGLHAGKLIGEIARLVGGGGGGKPDVAQAGGKKPEGLPEALGHGKEMIAKALKGA